MKSELNNKFTLRLRSSSDKWIDTGFKNLSVAMAATVAIVLFSILLVVCLESKASIQNYGLNFLITSEWDPINNQYGAFTAIYGTVITSLFSLFIAIPLGIGTAILLTEQILPKPITETIGIMVELLAAIPSVVLGLWAVFVMEPFIRPFLNYIRIHFG